MASVSTSPSLVTRIKRASELPEAAPLGVQVRDLTQLRQTVENHPGWAVTPSRIVATFLEAEGGDPRNQVALFDDLIENDGHLRSLFDQRRQAVAGKDWVVQASDGESNSQLAASVLNRVLGDQNLIGTYEHLLSFNKYGYAAAEIVWTVRVIEGRTWIVPSEFIAVPANRFLLAGEELRLVTDANKRPGEPLLPGKWITLTRNDVTLARAGLMRTGAWYAMGKRYGFRDWMLYSEKFGIPLILAKYSREADDDSVKHVAAEVVRQAGGDGGAVVPNDIDVQIVEAGRSSDNAAAHGGLIAHCNTELSKLVNGSTLSNDTSGSGGSSSYALGDVHNSVRWDNVTYDAGRIQEAMRTQVFAAFMRFNSLTAPTPRLAIQVVRDQSPAQRTDIAQKVQSMGLPLSASQLRQELGLREPLNAADTVTPPQPAAPAAAPKGQP